MLADKRRHIAKLKKERRRKGLSETDDLPNELPSMDRLVKSYLRRHEDRVRSGMSPNASRREEEYYSKLLLGEHDSSEDDIIQQTKQKFKNRSSLQTAMGRKSMLVENAYAFALRQQQVMLDGASLDEDESVSEEESVAKVEQLLREDARANRQQGRRAAENIMEWKEGKGDADGVESADGSTDDNDDNNTLPSILHDRPRAIRALNIWSGRLRSIPYSKWTIGASTALDHWIAREVLQMEENTWQQILEGGGTDAYVVGMDSLPGGESKSSLMDRMRDIVLVRGSLFPETLRDDAGPVSVAGKSGITGDVDEGLDEDDGINATEKSIDDLLASLGELDDDDDDVWKFDDDKDDEDESKRDADEDGEDADEDEKMATLLDELQMWRQRNVSSPYEAWDEDRKNEFDLWIDGYVAALYPDADSDSVDKKATRISLLSEPPVDTKKRKEFWAKVRKGAEAELFLRDYRQVVKEKLQSLNESPSTLEADRTTQSELEAILAVPFDDQLEKLLKIGTLRPILDDYTAHSERQSFLDKFAPIFLEGLEMEHLVPDPNGAIGLDDLSSEIRQELSDEWTPTSGLTEGGGDKPKFTIKMVPYGTDEYGTSRAERARELYRLWNEHKANRARFEEKLFKKGFLGVEEDRHGKKEGKEK